MRPPKPRRQAIAYLVSVVGTVVLVAGFLPFRDDVEPLTKAFGFLLVVIAAAGIGGIGPGIFASVLAFIVFNFFFLPPYDTFVIGKPEYVVVLFVNLGISVLISLLIGRASDRAAAAEMREAELRTLQELSRELVIRAPGKESYREIIASVLAMFGYTSGALFVRDSGLAGGLREEASVGCEPGDIVPEWDPRSTERPPERLPLSVGSNNVGLLVLKGLRPAPSEAESRILRAFGDQLALVLERDRLLRTATDAEVYRQTERLRQTLLAAVSHDLRSPLAAIKASVTDLLEDDVERSPEERREALEAIDSESERLNALIANLLDMSRIEAGVLQARVETIDVGDVISASVDNVSHVWPQLHVDERLQEGVMARADPVFLDRVLTNLLDNAARSANGTSGVEVTSRRNDGVITIRVIDHGKGISPDSRELLFHPFYDLDQRNPRLGAGLGLAIAKGFVTAMGGEIWIEETPGGGATFAVSVPAARDAT
ncbi:MAG TPA: ATP-binding protein [Actinomycetota bacterium]|nr:ATP-binding protein [Actinomycetota bacterium]